MGKQVIVHSGELRPDEITVINGLRVTAAARTVIDLARTLPFEEAVIAGDGALRMGLTTAEELREHLDRARQRPGSRAAARAVSFMDGRSESVGESRSRVVLHRNGFQAPEPQASIFDDDGKLAGRVDFLFPQLGVVAEFDGKIKYQKELRGSRTPEQVVVAEKLREDRLRGLGWMVARWTWSDLDNPGRITAAIRAAAKIGQRSNRTGTWSAAPRA